jgi:arginine-tRNA-protein transferase
MADMTVLDFAAMVDESFVDTRMVEYRRRDGGGENKLLAAALIDMLEDGISLIYSYYDPEQTRRSLGTFIILDSIRRAHARGLPYVYLGYWVGGSSKMNYKARFLPQERLTRDGWVLFYG